MAQYAMCVLNRAKNRLAAKTRRMPLISRWVVIGAVSSGVVGGAIGLVAGLAYPRTAWFAVFELGAPAAIVGGVVGLIGALIVTVARGFRR